MKLSGTRNPGFFARLFSKDKSSPKLPLALNPQRDSLSGLFRQVFDFIPEGVLITEPFTEKVIEANQTCERICGCMPGTLVGQLYSSFIHIDYKNAYLANVQELQKGNQIKVAGKLKRIDGGMIEVEVVGIATILNEKPYILRIIKSSPFETSIQTAFIEQIRATVLREERLRMARELHDSVTQLFYAIELAANTGMALLEREPVKATTQMKDILIMAEAGLAEMQALLFELRPESLETEGLVLALQKRAAFLSARYDFSVVTKLSPEPPIPIYLKETLYKIVQEATQNIIKHAAPNNVEINLQYSEDTVQLEIIDDGCGFNPQNSVPGHFGLIGMRERVEAFRGSFEVKSEKKAGTTILVCIPLP